MFVNVKKNKFQIQILALENNNVGNFPNIK